jgi:hypothetical protein
MTTKSISEKFEALKDTMSENAYANHVQPEVDAFNADPEAYIQKLEKAKEEADLEDETKPVTD